MAHLRVVRRRDPVPAYAILPGRTILPPFHILEDCQLTPPSPMPGAQDYLREIARLGPTRLGCSQGLLLNPRLSLHTAKVRRPCLKAHARWA